MQFKILVNYVFGFVDIIIEGYYIERFINICTSKNIFLWDLKRDKSTILYARVGVKDFKKLKTICRKTQCKMKINHKKGLSFVIYKYKKRKVFLWLLIFIALVIIALSNFIWNIDVVGNNIIAKEEILQVANDGGLKVGKFKKNINTKEVINKLRLERDDIAWVGIEIKGTNVIIKIVEADMKPEIIKEEEYCNIVANKPCMIMKVNAQNGTPLVKEGDVVKEGDILIGGWMEGKYTGTRYVHAHGEVKAKAWYTNKQKVYLKETKKEETGAIENKFSVKINNFQINLYKRVSNFEIYDTIDENKKLKIFSDFYLPIELIKHTNKEYKNIELTYTLDEAKKIGKEKAKETLDNQIEDSRNILNEQINVYENAEYVEVEVIYEVQENIGTKEKIVF